MEKKITLYIVALASVVSAIDAESVKVTDGIHTVKTGVEIDGVPFTSKRQAQDAVELTGHRPKSAPGSSSHNYRK